MIKRKSELFVCACSIPQHIFYATKYEDEPEFYFYTRLNNWLPWYRRIYHAIKYVFGGDCEWDEVILEEHDAQRLIEFLKNN